MRQKKELELKQNALKESQNIPPLPIIPSEPPVSGKNTLARKFVRKIKVA